MNTTLNTAGTAPAEAAALSNASAHHFPSPAHLGRLVPIDASVNPADFTDSDRAELERIAPHLTSLSADSADSADTGEATYTRDDATQGARDISQAIAIMRAVQIAVDAVDDGCVGYECDHVSRWGPAVGVATRRVNRVRNELVEKVHTLPVDWWTPLTLLEALDAALWRGSDLQGKGLQMDSLEVIAMAQAVIDELEELAQGLASAKGVPV